MNYDNLGVSLRVRGFQVARVDESNEKTDFRLDSSGSPPYRMSVNKIPKRIDEWNR